MINKAQILGNIGKKETKTLQNGSELTTISIATNRKWIDGNGQQQKATTWHNVNCFNKLADIAAKYAHVGDLIYIEGEIQNKKVQTQDGEKWIYSITASEIKLLPQGKKQESNYQEKTTPTTNNSLHDFDDDSELPF